MATGYLAAEGFEDDLRDELASAGVTVVRSHGRLLIADGDAATAAWAANVWHDAEEIAIASIADGARALRERQRNWVAYAPVHAGRAGLIAAKLPHVSAKPIDIGGVAPVAPLGSFTVLEPGLLLAAARCSSPFPNGEARLVEDRTGPPSRAYLKLFETFVRLRRWPVAGDTCLDLGASPGGWTWLLAGTGAEVVAVDKAPLDPAVAALATVQWQAGSAFALDPRRQPPVDWLCSDVVCYPRRLLALVERWIEADRARTMIATIKFQGPTDHGIVREFTALPGASVFHLHHNKHELTFVREALS